MAKLVVSLAAAFFFGFVGTASFAGDIREEPFSAPEQLEGEAHAGLRLDEAAVPQEISDEERERRGAACEELQRMCRERCLNWRLKGAELRECRKTCTANFVDCMKDIR